MTEDQDRYIVKLSLSKKVAHKLQDLRAELREDYGCMPTVAETILKALAVFDLIVDRLKKGERVIFRNEETKIETLLVDDELFPKLKDCDKLSS